MSAYFRKSFKVAPGVHINLSKRGTGVSFGGRGAHISLSPTGRVTKTVSIPGTGIYYRDVDTLHAKTTHAATTQPAASEQQATEPPAVSVPSPETPPLAHQVTAVEHHGFYISHGFAALIAIIGSATIAASHKSQPLNPWEPILAIIGGLSLILWIRDLALTATERRRQHE